MASKQKASSIIALLRKKLLEPHAIDLDVVGIGAADKHTGNPTPKGLVLSDRLIVQLQ